MSSLLCLPSPSFGYAIVTDPHILGNIFTFIGSLNHAVVVNVAAIGLFTLSKGKSATGLLNLHVLLFLATYVACLLLNFVLWEGHKIMWSTAVGVAVADSAALKDGAYVKAAAVGLSFDPPPELTSMVVIPTILFNFIMLPLYLWRHWTSASGCIQITGA
jgi:hypothetical protein